MIGHHLPAADAAHCKGRIALPQHLNQSQLVLCRCCLVHSQCFLELSVCTHGHGHAASVCSQCTSYVSVTVSARERAVNWHYTRFDQQATSKCECIRYVTGAGGAAAAMPPLSSFGIKSEKDSSSICAMTPPGLGV
jgi:hypothetical protein